MQLNEIQYNEEPTGFMLVINPNEALSLIHSLVAQLTNTMCSRLESSIELNKDGKTTYSHYFSIQVNHPVQLTATEQALNLSMIEQVQLYNKIEESLGGREIATQLSEQMGDLFQSIKDYNLT